jgi:hypothetical protein
MTPTASQAEFALKGSQRLLQLAVHAQSPALNLPLVSAMGLPEATQVRWKSPLQSEGFKEYHDDEVFGALEISPPPAMHDLWPRRGPRWDGLAVIDTAQGPPAGKQVVLVEAKAHLTELISGGTRALEPAATLIRASLQGVRDRLAPGSDADWSSRYYQYANRLAHLCFLRDRGVDAHLAFVYFFNAPGMRGPTSAGGWQAAIETVEKHLGLGDHGLRPYVHKLFIDARDIPDPDAQATAPA